MRQGRHAHRRQHAGRRRAGHAELAGRGQADADCEQRRVALDYHQQRADRKGAQIRRPVGVDCRRQIGGDAADALRGLGRGRVVVPIDEPDHMRDRRGGVAAQRRGPHLARHRYAGQRARLHARHAHGHAAGADRSAVRAGDRGAQAERRRSGVGDDDCAAVGGGAEAGRRRRVEGVGEFPRHAAAGVAGDSRDGEVGSAQGKRPGLAGQRRAADLDHARRDTGRHGDGAGRGTERSEEARDRKGGLAVGDQQVRAFVGGDEGRVRQRLDRSGQLGRDHLERLDRVGIGDAADGDAPCLADRRRAVQGKAGDRWRRQRALEAAGGLAGRGDARGGQESRCAGIFDHQGIAVDARRESSAGGIDLCGQTRSHF